MLQLQTATARHKQVQFVKLQIAYLRSVSSDPCLKAAGGQKQLQEVFL